jgi:hypothetical protein
MKSEKKAFKLVLSSVLLIVASILTVLCFPGIQNYFQIKFTFFLFLIFILSLIGIIVGMFGLIQKNKSVIEWILGIIGTLVNSLIFIVSIFLMMMASSSMSLIP